MALTDWAIYRLSDGYIENVIWFDADTAEYTPPEGCGMVDIPGDGVLSGQWSMCGIGWSYIDGQFVEPQYNPNAASVLVSAIEATATEIEVVSTAFFAPTGNLMIGQELVSYTGINGNTFNGVTRGINGTIATAHLAKATVYFVS
jgi:hypothetical protein